MHLVLFYLRKELNPTVKRILQFPCRLINILQCLLHAELQIKNFRKESKFVQYENRFLILIQGVVSYIFTVDRKRKYRLYLLKSIHTQTKCFCMSKTEM